MAKYQVGDVLEMTLNGTAGKSIFSEDLRKGDRLQVIEPPGRITYCPEAYTLRVIQTDSDLVGEHQYATEAQIDAELRKVQDSRAIVPSRPGIPNDPTAALGPTPAHYIAGRAPQYEPRFVIAAWDLSYQAGSAVKYISRCGRKGSPDDALRDLQKACDFLQFEIQRLKGEGFYKKGNE